MTTTASGARSGLVLISLCSLAAMAVLLFLGTWQLQRLTWKEDLIARIDARAKAEPLPLGEVAGRADSDFVRVSVTGTFVHSQAQRLYDVRDGVLGWKILTPVEVQGRKTYWADRGFVPDHLAGTIEEPPGPLSFTAALRTAYAPQGLFTPENVPPKGRWYWFDQAGLDRKAGVTSEPGLVLQLDAVDHGGQWPSARPVRPKLSNKHFGYAMTWFCLAITLLCVYIAYVLQHRRKIPSP
ncbi:MAG: SURF1 family protein [Pseudomonadota bacterium]